MGVIYGRKENIKMSDYSDCYYELHKDEIEKENKANNCRERLIDEISHDDMIKIMFTDFIKNQGVTKTIEIGEEYLR